MKFLLLKDLKQDALMRPLIIGFLLFTLLYLVADFFVKQSSFGLMPNAIHATLFGNEELYIEPLSRASFLEFWHVEIFMTMMLIFTLSALYVRLVGAKKSSIILVNLLFISSFTALVALGVTHFFTPLALLLYVSGFFAWHGIALYMVCIGFVKVVYA